MAQFVLQHVADFGTFAVYRIIPLADVRVLVTRRTSQECLRNAS
jgi:hypothetical protein